MNKIMKIALLGDSITEGIGSLKLNYGIILKEKLGPNYELRNFALTGTTIKYIGTISKDIREYNPDVLIVFYGNVDAMVRPKLHNSFILKRYRKNGMLNPRALYSHSHCKMFLQLFESVFRTLYGFLLMQLFGTYTWVELDEYRNEYKTFLHQFSDKEILILSTVFLDKRYFPKTLENYNI